MMIIVCVKEDSFYVRDKNENIWLTQKIMAALYDVSVAAINQHIKKNYDDGSQAKRQLLRNT